MNIIKATDPIPIDHPIFLVFGQPGIGKTTLANSLDDALTLDFDQGVHRSANRGDTLKINGWADVVELMETPAALKPYKGIVVDTVGRALDVIALDIAENDPKKAPGGSLSQQGWGVLKNRFRTWMTALRALGLDVLLVAHDKEDKDGDLRIVRPEIVGGSYGEVMKVADFVGYYFMSGKNRILDFSPTDRWIGKNPAGWSPFKVPPVEKCQTFMADLYAKGRTALGNISEASAVIAQQVDDWRAQVETLTAPEDFTKALGDVLKLAPIASAQIKQALWQRAQGLGLTYDTASRTFQRAA